MNADWYIVYRMLDSDAVFVAIATSGTESYIDLLPIGTVFADYYVTATNTNGEGSASNIIRVRPKKKGR